MLGYSLAGPATLTSSGAPVHSVSPPARRAQAKWKCKYLRASGDPFAISSDSAPAFAAACLRERVGLCSLNYSAMFTS